MLGLSVTFVSGVGAEVKFGRRIGAELGFNVGTVGAWVGVKVRDILSEVLSDGAPGRVKLGLLSYNS